jgi:hypothetical protein
MRSLRLILLHFLPVLAVTYFFILLSTVCAQEGTVTYLSEGGLGPLAKVFSSNSLKDFFQALFEFSITLAGLLAVLRIAYGGWLYMTTDIADNKKSARDIIAGALIGLIMILAIGLILRQINPGILNISFELGSGQTENTSSGGDPENPPPPPPAIGDHYEDWSDAPYGAWCYTIPEGGLNCSDEGESISACVELRDNYGSAGSDCFQPVVSSYSYDECIEFLRGHPETYRCYATNDDVTVTLKSEYAQGLGYCLYPTSGDQWFLCGYNSEKQCQENLPGTQATEYQCSVYGGVPVPDGIEVFSETNSPTLWYCYKHISNPGALYCSEDRGVCQAAADEVEALQDDTTCQAKF